jgi:hypothetical protein
MRHFVGLIALVASLGLAAPVGAQTTGLLLPAVQVNGSTIELTADHFDVVVAGDVTTARLILPYVTDDFRIDTLSFSVDPDPFITFNLGISNLVDALLNVGVFYTSPYLGGPYGFAEAEVSGTVTDTGRDGATLSPATHASEVDMTNLGLDLAFDCAVAPLVGGSNTCGDSASGPAATGATGTFGTVTFFTVSGFDAAQVAFELVISPTAVPEPRSTLLLALVLVGLAFARWLPTRFV